MLELRWSLAVVLALMVTTSESAEWPAAVTEATDVRPVVAGSQLPSVQVQTAQGPQLLSAAVGPGKKVVIVYRGGWCPICTRHFAALGQQRAELQAAGWSLTALSPDSVQTIADGAYDDGITRLSDPTAEAIRALGLAFVVDQQTLTKYDGYGIDIEAASGHDHHILPVPAVLLVVDGEIRAVHADADYRRRLQPELLRGMIASID